MIAGWFYFSFVVLYFAHMHEEYWTGFTKKLPPPRLIGKFADRGFWVLNPFLLCTATAVGVANLMGASWAFFWIALWSSICFWNAVAHGIRSISIYAYQPGLITGIFYVPLFVIWILILINQRNINWKIFWLTFLIGSVITIALATFAFLGCRILR
jgi:hypothetical protein